MSKLFVALLGVVLVAGFGCHDKDNDMDHNKDKTMSSSKAEMDDCAHCPGVQHANADGTCPMCKMKVK